MRKAYRISVCYKDSIMYIKVNKSSYVLRVYWFNTYERFINKLQSDYQFNKRQIAFLKSFYNGIDERKEIMNNGNGSNGR